MSRRLRRLQQGFSLIVVLMLLVVVTVLGVAAAQVSLVNERSARNDRDTELAFQAAEAALSDAESDVLGPNDSVRQRLCLFNHRDVTAFVAGCGGAGENQGLCAPGEPGTDPAWMTADFAADGPRSVAYGAFTGQTYAATARAPRYIVEAVRSRGTGQGDALQNASAQGPGYVFRVTAIGFGTREETQVVLQTNLYKPAASPGCPS
ncbi:pilus assembly protein [Variovorax sp. H27-G14]|uniref:pilus assembly PilX family protein n=1 Tax=Variovorax sp. H27-G14 TaxID=3111914 RepID=UPI0038FBE4D6